jgi:hypothetical protein
MKKKKIIKYDLEPTLRMLKGERGAAKEVGDKKAVELLDGIIRKVKNYL